ncbi:hypothetical protein TRFO_21668 [Tritrichomonas foetus]|uniref:Cytoplasmic protein n=1 Tax=Tritrichomonas foetus TaxID=1144522 RepID=A0A1J4KDC0_9EUKA|nr:hypothetical protein TRFO_21668 [Tritrichomonas foetus]|eukprot:OHT09433.1 hypothetical protein TRFO_21668 [Tritrichomonas foetus]
MASLPSISKMWSDTIFDLAPAAVAKTLGGTFAKPDSPVHNFCAVRLSHALRHAGHQLNVPGGDYKDSNGNPYIIRVETMIQYLTKNFGAPETLDKSKKDFLKGKSGIIIFKIPFNDATGHCCLIKNGVFRVASDNYVGDATSINFWSL